MEPDSSAGKYRIRWILRWEHGTYSRELELLAKQLRLAYVTIRGAKFHYPRVYPRTIRGTPKNLSAGQNGIVFTREMHTFSRTIAGPPF